VLFKKKSFWNAYSDPKFGWGGGCSFFFFFFQEQYKWEYNGTVHQRLIGFKEAYDSVSREVLYKILIEFGMPRKVVRLIKMCLNETYSKICTGKHLSGAFPIQNGLKQVALEYAIRKVQKKIKRDWNLTEHISYWSMLVTLIYWVRT
jgi:hypothetical protein